MATERKKIGVSGLGSIGSRHARLLARRANIDLYFCDPVAEYRAAALALPGSVEATADFARLLAWPLDGLIVATPDRFHVEQTAAACEKGIAVLLEKPVAEDTPQARRLLDPNVTHGTPVLVGYALRYAEIINLAKRLLDEGQIGTVVSFHIMLGAYETLVVARNRFSATDRNKLYVDYSHEWDYLQWFLGPVERGIACSHQSGKMELTQNPNVVNALLELKNGATGTAHLDYVQAPGSRQCVLIGDQGRMDIDAVSGEILLSRRGEESVRHYRRTEHRDAIMEKQHDHFLEVVNRTTAPKVGVEDGVRALAVADALIRSTQSGAWESVLGTT